MDHYFEDVNPDYRNPSFSFEDWRDPDQCSLRLYQDLLTVFRPGTLPNKMRMDYFDTKSIHRRHGAFELSVTISDEHGPLYEVGLGSDYIGPSLSTGLRVMDMTKAELCSIVEQSRTLGGHLFHPRRIRNLRTKDNQNLKADSLNCRRGMCSFQDRFDLFLYELSLWYRAQETGGETSSLVLKTAFERNANWLNLFVDFPQYIEYFQLEGFVDTTKQFVIDLTAPEEEVYLVDSSNNLAKALRQGHGGALYRCYARRLNQRIVKRYR